MTNKDYDSTLAYARELHYGQGLSWSQVKHALLGTGMSELKAREMIAALEEQENEAAQKEEYNRILKEASDEERAQRIIAEEMKDPEIALAKANRKFKFGWAWFFGGIALTVFSEGMVIWWGAVLFGLIQITNGYRIKNIINNQNN